MAATRLAAALVVLAGAIALAALAGRSTPPGSPRTPAHPPKGDSAGGGCTSVWASHRFGYWETAANWRPVGVPDVHDRVCFGREAHIAVHFKFEKGFLKVGSIDGQGRLDVLGDAKLLIADRGHDSRIGDLRLGPGVLATRAPLTILRRLLWLDGGELLGAGTKVIVREAHAVVDPGDGGAGVVTGMLVNHGFLNQMSGALYAEKIRGNGKFRLHLNSRTRSAVGYLGLDGQPFRLEGARGVRRGTVLGRPGPTTPAVLGEHS